MSQIGSITSTRTPNVYRQPRNGFVKTVAKFGFALLAISSSVVRAAGSLGTQPMNGRYLASIPSCGDLRNRAAQLASDVPGNDPAEFNSNCQDSLVSSLYQMSYGLPGTVSSDNCQQQQQPYQVQNNDILKKLQNCTEVVTDNSTALVAADNGVDAENNSLSNYSISDEHVHNATIVKTISDTSVIIRTNDSSAVIVKAPKNSTVNYTLIQSDSDRVFSRSNETQLGNSSYLVEVFPLAPGVYQPMLTIVNQTNATGVAQSDGAGVIQTNATQDRRNLRGLMAPYHRHLEDSNASNAISVNNTIFKATEDNSTALVDSINRTPIDENFTDFSIPEEVKASLNPDKYPIDREQLYDDAEITFTGLLLLSSGLLSAANSITRGISRACCYPCKSATMCSDSFVNKRIHNVNTLLNAAAEFSVFWGLYTIMLDLWQNASDEDTQKLGFWDGAAGWGAIGAFLSVAAYHSFEGSLLIDGQVKAAQKAKKHKRLGTDYTLPRLNDLFEKIIDLIPITGKDLSDYYKKSFHKTDDGGFDYEDYLAKKDINELNVEKNYIFDAKSLLHTYANASKSGFAAARDASSSPFGWFLNKLPTNYNGDVSDYLKKLFDESEERKETGKLYVLEGTPENQLSEENKDYNEANEVNITITENFGENHWNILAQDIQDSVDYWGHGVAKLMEVIHLIYNKRIKMIDEKIITFNKGAIKSLKKDLDEAEKERKRLEDAQTQDGEDEAKISEDINQIEVKIAELENLIKIGEKKKKKKDSEGRDSEKTN
ncbi:MAG: hypothetical protein ACON35_04825 [Candidatus Marinamargulisbacteria bacterium]